MHDKYSRRVLLGTLGTFFLAGCVSNSEDDEDEARNETESMEPDNNGTTDESNCELQVERLPEPSPLSDELIELFCAEDRASVAEERDLDIRDGEVQVEIRLTEDGDAPEQYLPEERSEYGDTVIAYVDIDDLVDLALADDVSRVFRQFEPEHN